MDATSVTQIISNLGFPIAVCFFLGWYVVKIQKQNTETISKLTIAITKLTERLGGETEK